MTEQVLDSDLHLNYAGSLPGSAEIPVRGWRAGDLVVDLELRRLYREWPQGCRAGNPASPALPPAERGGRPVRGATAPGSGRAGDWDSFERNVNTAVRKLRQAIGDDAREPRLIETMRASGYRWIGRRPTRSTVPAFEAERMQR
jgi:hypothetical protein